MRLLHFTLLCLLMFGCSDGGLPELTVKRQANAAGDGSSAFSSDVMNTVTENLGPHFFKANYAVRVKAAFLEICKADIQFAVSSKLGMDGLAPIIMDRHILNCMFGIKIDIIKLLQGLGIKISNGQDEPNLNDPGSNGLGGNPIAPNLEAIKVDTSRLQRDVGLSADQNTIFLSHLHLKPLISATYTPKRAFMPNVVAGDEEVLKNYHISQQIQVVDGYTGETGSGVVELKWMSGDNPIQLKDLFLIFHLTIL